MSFGTVGIFGVGAIGGSIGLRARCNGARVVGADVSDDALAQAISVGAIDERASLEALPEMVDTLVIATPLQPTLREIERLSAMRRVEPGLIIDVASVKLPVVRAAAHSSNFVATHPMAGTECSGARAARADLFEGRTWAYVPSDNLQLDRRATTLIESMGGVPFAIGAAEHDRDVALTSHVPQILAWHFAKLLHAEDSEAARLCGPVAHELLRIARMEFERWREILKANARNIEPRLRGFATELQAAADALARDEIDGVAGTCRESSIQ